jgi:electron-transferring-flavoprotein dehydrogenase
LIAFPRAQVWQIDPSKFEAGLVVHALGWPLATDTYGGAFLYHMEPNHVLVGFAVGLDYPNPHLSPYEEFQRFKVSRPLAVCLSVCLSG